MKDLFDVDNTHATNKKKVTEVCEDVRDSAVTYKRTITEETTKTSQRKCSTSISDSNNDFTPEECVIIRHLFDDNPSYNEFDEQKKVVISTQSLQPTQTSLNTTEKISWLTQRNKHLGEAYATNRLGITIKSHKIVSNQPMPTTNNVLERRPPQKSLAIVKSNKNNVLSHDKNIHFIRTIASSKFKTSINNDLQSPIHSEESSFDDSLQSSDNGSKSNCNSSKTRSKRTPLYFGPSNGLPPGWKIKKMERLGGPRSGRADTSYYSDKGKRFRSMVEVENYLEALKANGDEEKAYKCRRWNSFTNPSA